MRDCRAAVPAESKIFGIRMFWANKGIYGDQGEVREVIRVGIDMTDRKRRLGAAAQELRGIGQMLEGRAWVQRRKLKEIQLPCGNGHVVNMSLAGLTVAGRPGPAWRPTGCSPSSSTPWSARRGRRREPPFVPLWSRSKTAIRPTSFLAVG